MSFWSLGRRKKEPEPAPGPELQVVVSLGVVEFWTADQRLTVGMDLGHRRLTDLVNGQDAVRVVPFEVAPEDPSLPVPMRPDQAWSDLSVEDALLVFPPPQPTDPQRRLHRPKQAVDIRIGPFEIFGSVHIPPGAQAAGFLFRQQARFTPITRATVRDTRLAGYEQRAEVVLVNLKRVDIIRDVGVEDQEEADDTDEPQAITEPEAEEREAAEEPEAAEEQEARAGEW